MTFVVRRDSRSGSAGVSARTRIAAAFRRTTDLVGSVLGLLVLGLLMLVVAVLVRASSEGPALFRQERLGSGRRPFVMYKFRTMRTGSADTIHRDLIARELRGDARAVDGSFKVADDPRITPIGRFLRTTSMDELPQLINVLRGEMSLVGPRPCLPWEADLFPTEYQARFEVRPGLTGLWQVSGRSTLDTMDMLRLDVRYVRTRTIWMDLRILLLTLPTVIRAGGAR